MYEQRKGAVLFDLDGTLLDTLELISQSFHHCVREVLGQDQSIDRFSERLGEPLWMQLNDYAESKEQLDAMMKSYRTFNAQVQHDYLKHFPGMPEALRQLKSDGWKLGVATSKLHGPAQMNLEIMGIADLFDCLVAADDVERPKPDGQSVQVAAERLGLEPSACFYVGDSPFDIQAGNAAGTVTIAVHWGQHPIERLRESSPSLECEKPADLPALVCSAQPA